MNKKIKSAAAALCMTFAVWATPAAADDAGLDAAERGDYATALRIWTPEAKQGDADAQFYLAQMYRHGEGVPLNHKISLTCQPLTQLFGLTRRLMNDVL